MRMMIGFALGWFAHLFTSDIVALAEELRQLLSGPF